MLSANPQKFAEEVERIEKAGAEGIHWDIMDGNFVPSITFGAGIVAAHRELTNLPFYVHLMVENPEHHLQNFADAGADTIIIHPESCKHLHRNLSMILDLGKKAGVALNPSTNIECIQYCVDLLSMVLVMTVNPGASGQKFIDSQLKKIKQLREMLPSSVEICVDGGINPETITKCIKNGADSAVSGAYIFQNSNYKEAIDKLRKC